MPKLGSGVARCEITGITWRVLGEGGSEVGGWGVDGHPIGLPRVPLLGRCLRPALALPPPSWSSLTLSSLDSILAISTTGFDSVNWWADIVQR